MAVPIRIPFSSVTDTKGNATITIKVRAAFSAVSTINAQCGGNPNWAVTVNGNPLTYGNGPQVTLGPIATFPQESVTIAVSNALPTTQIQGTLTGTEHGSLQDAAANYQPTPNAITVNQFSTAVVLGSLIVPANTSQTASFTIPTGAQAIGFCVRSDAIPSEPGHFYDTPVLVSVNGNQTGQGYFAGVTGPTDINGPLVSLFDPSDTSVTVDMTANASEQSKIDILSWTSLPATVIRQNPGDTAINVALQVPGTNFSYTIDDGIDGTESLLGVSLFEANPAPWQAPLTLGRFSNTVNAGATSVIVAGSLGKNFYLFGGVAETETSTTGNLLALQVTTGQGIFNFGSSTTPLPFQFSGLPLGSGNGVQIANQDSANHTIRIGFGYTQR